MLYNANNIDEKTINRFFKFINLPKNLIDDCWIWTSSKSNKYGEFWYNKSKRMAHRFSFYLYNENFDLYTNKLEVCHICDNTLCVNPNHLFLGTHQDNMTDKKNKNRAPYGENNHFTKYSIDEICFVIDNIINKNITNRQELRNFTSISEKLILDILNNKYRKDIYEKYDNLKQYLYIFKTHLTNDIIKEIKNQLQNGVTAYRISKNMSLPYSTISKIKNNKTYINV